ncbi:MAG: glycosyltransferase family A protein [Thermodesulfobacteriota bacterium]|jgi:glycosyltransferase involved in cell wall biosynthesis
MADGPLVSAIIICFNGEKYLAESVASIFAQTYANWELLLVDDGSTDASTSIAKRYAAQYPKQICYLEHPGHQNRGMSASRNLGIAHAKGEFVAFLDADDVWLPHKLAEQVALLLAHPEAGMVYGRTLIWHSWTGNPCDQQRDHFLDLGVSPDQLVRPPMLFGVLLQNKAQTPTTCNALFRREVFRQVGGFEESFRGMYEDQVLFAKIHLQVPVYVSGACWAKYRQHPESWSVKTVRSQDYCATRRPFLEWLSSYLTQKGVNPRTLAWQTLQRELWLCRHPGYFRLLHSYWCWRGWIARFFCPVGQKRPHERWV